MENIGSEIDKNPKLKQVKEKAKKLGKEYEACVGKWGKRTSPISSTANKDKIDVDGDKVRAANIGTDIDSKKGNIDKEIDYDIPGFAPSTEKETVALEICEKLSDRKNLKLYIFCVNRYGVGKALKVIGKVSETPDEEIKKTRRAMFVYLMLKKGM